MSITPVAMKATKNLSSAVSSNAYPEVSEVLRVLASAATEASVQDRVTAIMQRVCDREAKLRQRLAIPQLDSKRECIVENKPATTGQAAEFLDEIIRQLNLENDAHLARELGVSHPTISRIRHKRESVGPVMILRFHELTGRSIRELKQRFAVE